MVAAPAHPGALRGPAAAGAVAQVFVGDIGVLELSEEDARHLAQVLRLRRGEKVVASDGAGAWRACRYTGDSSPTRMLEVEGNVEREQAPLRQVVVGFTPIKGERPEWVAQKLTEMGVDRIALVRSARSVVRWDSGREARAVERLRRVVRQAAAQSRRAWIPELIGVMGLGDLGAAVSPHELALAQPGGGRPGGDTAAVAVGPEGGWEASELEGANLVGLGPGILRAETAAVCAGFLLCALRDRLVVPSL